MQKIWFLTTAFLLAAVAPLYADPAADAKVVVDKAVKAMGGPDKLSKTPATTFQSKGSADEGGHKMEFTGSWHIQFPDKYRAEIEMVAGGRNESVTLVINGDEAWAKQPDRPEPEAAPPEALKAIKATFTAIHLAHNPTALTGKDYELSPLAEVNIDKTAAVGVKVVHKGLPDIKLYFDKETGLPIKAEVKIKEREAGEEIEMEFRFADFKETDGMKHFTKLTCQRAGKELMVMELSEVKRAEKIDAKMFEKPK
jgi:outer membrane lipoprotein-sorting protein